MAKRTNHRGRKGGELESSPRRVAAQQKIAKGIELRKAGASFAAIANVVGYADAASAFNAIMRGLRASVREPAEDLIALERERLDALFMASFPQAKRGILTAVDRCLRIMERRARLLGLDAPIALSVDWRKEAEKAGLQASDEFEVLVRQAMIDNAKRLGELPGGEPDGG